MVAGQLIDLIHRFNRIKDYSMNDKKRIEGYERLLADMKEAFEIEDEREFKRVNRMIWDIYDAIRYEKEELENDLVRN